MLLQYLLLVHVCVKTHGVFVENALRQFRRAALPNKRTSAVTAHKHICHGDADIYLLDIVRNKVAFEKLPYDELMTVAQTIGLICKEKAYELGSWQEFFDWYHEVLEEDYRYNGRLVEGFVIEDSAGFMVKLKLTYYNFWKFMRSIAHETVKKGYVDPRRTSSLTTPLANAFYGWIKGLREIHPAEDIPKDICSLRNLFYQSEEGRRFYVG